MSIEPIGQTNAQRQAAFRKRRRANMHRVTVWVPRETWTDFRAMADAAHLTHTELLTGMIRRAREEQAGQLPII
jgi:hypothetical protein